MMSYLVKSIDKTCTPRKGIPYPLAMKAVKRLADSDRIQSHLTHLTQIIRQMVEITE